MIGDLSHPASCSINDGTPHTFNILADLLSLVMQQRGMTFMMHYLDNFLLNGPLFVNVTWTSSHKYAQSLVSH